MNTDISNNSSMDSDKWTEEEKRRLQECGFYPYSGDEDDYRRECSYSDSVEDWVYKFSPNMYSASVYHTEWSDGDYEWICESHEFQNFEHLISFLENG
jgi:hypothetical protein